LIELLVVVAILAVLAVVVVLTLNPAGLLQEARDGSRISDMASLNSALSYSLADNSAESIGAANTVYVSVPDPTATSTAGDQCQGLSLLSLPSGYSYHCAASSTYRRADGTGWIPVNLSANAFGSSLAQLPTDPVNAPSSRLYYTYETGDGGTLASVYEKGSKLGLEPLDYGGSSLVGYWPMNEGNGSVAYDDSGNNNNGLLNGSPAWLSGGCKLGACLEFPSGGNYVSVVATSSLNISNNLTITLWIKGNALVPSGGSFHPITKWTGVSDANYVLYYCGSACGSNDVFKWYANANGTWQNVSNNTPAVATTTWNQVAFVYTSGGGQIYWNGMAQGSLVANGLLATSTNGLNIGSDASTGDDFDMNAVRIYSRALTAAQIAALYNGGK
jgi:hypothetical protein